MRLTASAHCLRAGDTLEISRPGVRTITLRGLGERDADLLEMWCGTNRPRSRSLARTAQQLGHDAVRFRQAVDYLRLAGLTAVEAAVQRGVAPVRPDERRSSVGIVGLGPLGLLIAQGLLSAGVAELQLDDPRAIGTMDVGVGGYRLADVGGKRATAAAALLRARTSSAIVSDRGLEEPEVVVVTATARDVTGTAHLVCNGTPHLLVTTGPTATEVGPLVRPGATACANCIELQRQSEPSAAPPDTAAMENASTDVAASSQDDADHPIDPPSMPSRAPAESSLSRSPLSAAVPTTPLRAASNLAAAALAVVTVVQTLAACRSGQLPPTPDTAIATFHADQTGIRLERSVWKPHLDCGCTDSAGIWSTAGRQSA